MRYYIFFISLWLLGSVFVCASGDRALYRVNYSQENKVALVIGNSHYQHFSPLRNTLNDAEDINKTLASKGFEVLYLADANLKSMEEKVRIFESKIRHGGVGLFYYAGHGLEVDGSNYLIPIDADIPKENEVKYKALPVNFVIDKMEDSRNRLNIIILDACRSNPFGRDGSGGLASINNAKGMYIAFATAPGEVASDGGRGRNGLFTKHLIHHINQPNLSLNEVFQKTRESVYDESNKRQIPWSSSSVIGSFYFELVDDSSIKEAREAEQREREERKRKAKESQAKQKREQAQREAEKKREAEQRKRELEEQRRLQALKKAELRKAQREKLAQESYSLTINPTPSNAKVYITNIKPKYRDGMKLKKGRYKIKVKSKGYKTKLFTVDLNGDTDRDIVLSELPKAPKATSNSKWITPSHSICKANGGKIDKGVCQANWQNATKICRASGGRLPSRENLKQVIVDCGGSFTTYGNKNWNRLTDKNIANKSYQSCYKQKGFSYYDYYWTREEKDSSRAWRVDFYGGDGLWYSKSNSYYALCVR